MKKGTCKQNKNKRGAKWVCRSKKTGRVKFSKTKLYK